jgi:CubicO group peptidase (beta-lactamase class C family)
LLGDIAEKAGGAPLAQLMQQRIFGPLGMTDTLLPQRDSTAIPEPHQRGYMYGTNVINNDIYNAALAGNTAAAQLDAGPDVTPPDVTDTSPSSSYADGAAISTAHDLQTYAKALGSGELLSPATQQQRTQFVPAGSYGLGLERAAGGLLGHNGAIPGYQSFMGYQPDKGVTVVVLANLILAPETPTSVTRCPPTSWPRSFNSNCCPADRGQNRGHPFTRTVASGNATRCQPRTNQCATLMREWNAHADTSPETPDTEPVSTNRGTVDE